MQAGGTCIDSSPSTRILGMSQKTGGVEVKLRWSIHRVFEPRQGMRLCGSGAGRRFDLLIPVSGKQASSP